MKCTIPGIMILSLAASLAMAQTHLDIKAPATVENDLVGPVKRVLETSEERKLYGAHKTSTSTDERTYDAKGNRLAVEKRDGNNKVTDRDEYFYDDQGCFIKEVDEDLEEHTKDEFKISIDVPRRIIVKENIKTHERKATLYTAAGFEDIIKELDPKGKVSKTVEIKRLPNNKEYKFATYDERHKPTHTTTIKWNPDGTQREVQYANHEKNTKFITTYEYLLIDTHGNWTRRIEHTDLIEKGKTIPLTQITASREIEYYE